jgi:hypothetical protein
MTTTLQNPNGGKQPETIAHGVTRSWLHNRQVVVFALENQHQKTLDACTDAVLQTAEKWPADRPFLVMYDITGAGIRASTSVRQSIEIISEKVRVKGRVAAVVPRNPLSQLMRLFMSRPPGPQETALHHFIFYDRESALEWLLETLPGKAKGSQALSASRPAGATPAPSSKPAPKTETAPEKPKPAQEQAQIETKPARPAEHEKSAAEPKAPADTKKEPSPVKAAEAPKPVVEGISTGIPVQTEGEMNGDSLNPILVTPIVPLYILKKTSQLDTLLADTGVTYQWIGRGKIIAFNINDAIRPAVDAFIDATLLLLEDWPHNRPYLSLQAGAALTNQSNLSFLPYFRIRLRHLYTSHPELQIWMAFALPTESKDSTITSYFLRERLPEKHHSGVFDSFVEAQKWLMSALDKKPGDPPKKTTPPKRGG